MLKDLVKACRSYRGYDHSRKMTEAELNELVDLTRYTGAAKNTQPLKYRVVYKEDELAAVQANVVFGGALPQLHLPYKGTEPTGFIIICQDMNISDDKTFYLRDVGIVAQTMLLAATEQGLGGLMILSFNGKKISEALNIPDNCVPSMVVALGKPAEDIELVDVPEDGSMKYYRNEEGKHFVPKRKLEDILL